MERFDDAMGMLSASDSGLHGLTVMDNVFTWHLEAHPHLLAALGTVVYRCRPTRIGD